MDWVSVDTAIMFPGQGSQVVGMGREVAERSAAGRRVFERADEVLGFSLSRICFEGPESELTRTDVQQPAIFVTSAAVWATVLERGGSAQALMGATAGLSLGEYTALYAAGALSFEDGLRLVRRRGELMQEAADAVAGGMVSVIGGDEAAVRALCEAASQGEELGPANFNCPGQIVISGAIGGCERAVAMAAEHGVRAVMLKVAGAFHSRLMAPAAEGLREELDKTVMKHPACPVIANVDAQPHGEAAEIRRALCRQLTHPVRWRESMERLIGAGVRRFVEVGPGRVLTGLMRKIDRGVEAMSVGNLEEVEKFLDKSAVGR